MHKYFSRFNFDPAGPIKNERQKYSGRAEIEYDLFHLSFGSSVDPGRSQKRRLE
jgi:hypothetical protein